MIVDEFVVAGGDYMGVWEETPKSCLRAKQLGDKLSNEWEGKIHPTFIKNDRHVSLCMMDTAVDGSRPILRINVINARSLIEPTDSFNDNGSVENEILGELLRSIK
ncbi:hypothetical protein RDI58_024108 [Solanum bulbocastanum]|uniref:Uncharacterized protein n=1 Tax=Solanum bulbocastanum TaxID=147425 RepID=A0AAN8T2D8_SOLBU